MSIPKYCKGDVVRIVNWGAHYPSNSGLAKKLGATKYKEGEFYPDSTREKKYKMGGIINWGLNGRVIVYLLDLVDTELLIGEDGIELYIKKEARVFGIVKFMEKINV
jgi:hypothetical protein